MEPARDLDSRRASCIRQDGLMMIRVVGRVDGGDR